MQDANWGRSLERLISTYGVVNRVAGIPAPRGLPELSLTHAMIGNDRSGHHPGGRDQTSAAGRAVAEPGLARALALAEAAERYAAWDPADPGYLWSAATDLDGEVLDHRSLPRCSDLEYAEPACPVVPFDPDARIRWCRGVDLLSGDDVWAPARMATYRLPAPVAAEKFWYPISTGYAVHTDPVAAILGGLSEVIERDMIALLWSRRLPFPELPRDALDAATVRLLEWCSEHHVQAHLFDATTDLGLPSVYCLLRSPHDSALHTLVGAGTGFALAQAAFKALLEAIGLRVTMSTALSPPAAYGDFRSVLDGVRYMGVRERAHAFDFLLQPDEDRPAFEDRGVFADGPRQGLERLLRTLSEAGMEAVAVDRTTDELADVGLTAVCVIVPGLQPMSLHPLAQFTAHPRLRSAPGAMGFARRDDEELNPWPQPFG